MTENPFPRLFEPPPADDAEDVSKASTPLAPVQFKTFDVLVTFCVCAIIGMAVSAALWTAAALFVP